MNSYDEVPYRDAAYPQTHPDVLATTATLFGMRPAPIESCRVLELGCASGSNLLPMAYELPGASFLGVDLSPVQIARAAAKRDRLGLGNVEFHAVSIADVTDQFGSFDYVICHGVFSWIPREVQDAVFRVCSHLLAAQGVAYISYNTYPGWHFREILRDLACFHAKGFQEPAKRVQQARKILAFMSKAAADGPHLYAAALRGGVRTFARHSDSYVLHEYLEDVNEPLYFSEFAERASEFGLDFLAEVPLPSTTAARFSPEVRAQLEKLSTDSVRAQQYMDFVTNRTFRQSLLVHDECDFSYDYPPDRIDAFWIASPLKIKSQSGARELLATDSKLLEIALAVLAKIYPKRLTYAELVPQTECVLGRRLLGPERDALAASLLRLHTGSRMIELHVQSGTFAQIPSEYPVASAIARDEARSRSTVTNLCHRAVRLTKRDRMHLRALDGSAGAGAVPPALLERFARSALLRS